MEKIVLQRSEGRPLVFEGVLLAEYASSPNSAHPDWSGTPGRWSETRVYKTKDGRYVAWEAYYTQWEGEKDSFQAQVVGSLEELLEHLEGAKPRTAARIAEDLGSHKIV